MGQTVKTVLLLGASGTIGRATARALLQQGHRVLAPLRPGAQTEPGLPALAADLSKDGLQRLMQDQGCDAVISCLASRSGAPADARAVDFGLNLQALLAAEAAGVAQFVLLSAICVQKPLLAFQRAKLDFEARLQASALGWSIVRPTAYFKSLSGQVARLRAGKPFLLFGDGALTRCKPISDDDLGRYLVNCLQDPDLSGRILPIGGPGPAITPREQGEMLFAALGLAPRFSHVPIGLMSGIVAGLDLGGLLWPPLRAKAELARIGRYYATESMLVWDAKAGRYDAEATPSFGTQTLEDHYRRLARHEIADDRGAHAVF